MPYLDSDERDAAVALMVTLDDHGHGAKGRLFANLIKAYPAVTTAINELVDLYHAQMPCYAVLDPGAGALLHILVHGGMPFGIVTNGSRHQLRTMHALGLGQSARCVLISGVFGHRKPEAPIFAAALERLGLCPGEILFVGDNPVAAILGAHQMGMRTVWIRRGHDWPADLAVCCADLVDDLAELARLLEPSPVPITSSHTYRRSDEEPMRCSSSPIMGACRVNPFDRSYTVVTEQADKHSSLDAIRSCRSVLQGHIPEDVVWGSTNM